MDKMENGQSSTLSIVPKRGLTSCPINVAMTCAKELFSAYPQREFREPEIFVRGLVATLARYPEAVVRKVCSAESGLPQTSKFLPSIAEVREACEAIHTPPRSYMQTA